MKKPAITANQMKVRKKEGKTNEQINQQPAIFCNCKSHGGLYGLLHHGTQVLFFQKER
jgi:hypothetical protein